MNSPRLFADGYLQPWFVGYALIGLVVQGVVPVMTPLTAEPHGPLAVGLVVAGFYLGMLSSPLFGALADRTGRQRLVFVASFPVIGAAAVLFSATDRVWAMFLCMAVAGAGAGAAQTS
ncbi:MAG: MFS transporter, partial [Gordonia sp. (in: high G+C Gram-positive bacteria)]